MSWYRWPSSNNNKKSTQRGTQSQNGYPSSYGSGNGNSYGHQYNHNHRHQHNYGHNYGGSQMQRQQYAPQAQKTADMQMFREQVNNTYIAITHAAKMSQDPQWDESIVNSATDGAILSLDMFAVSCGEFQKRADHDAVDLAKKTVTDKWAKLKQEDEATYKLTTKYRDFLIAALNGSKNLRYKTYRVATSQLDMEAAKKLESDPQALHDTYQTLIANNQQFDREQDAIRNDPEKAKKLKQEHEREINEYRNNPQYRSQQQSKSKNGRGKTAYSRPNQAEFYFTKSGQSATFERMNEKKEKEDMEQELFGGDNEQKQQPQMDAYSQLPRDLVYPQNAVLLLSDKNPLGKRNKPIPCKVLYPKKQDAVSTRIVVHPAYPFDGARMKYPVNMLCFDVEKVKAEEARHMQKYQKLGYDSIAEIDAAIQGDGMDLDNDFE